MRKWPIQLNLAPSWESARPQLVDTVTRITELSKEVLRLTVVEVDASVTPVFTLPLAVDSPVAYYVIKIDASATAVTVACAGTDTIAGTSSVVLTSQYNSVCLIPGQATWYIL